MNLAPNREYFAGVDYDNFRQSLYLRMRPTGDVTLEFQTSLGETIDFVNARQADFASFNPEVELSLGRRFRSELDYTWQEFSIPEGGRFLEAELVRQRLFYHFDQRTFVRAIVQQRTVERDQSLHVVEIDPKVEQLFTQLLFSYKVNARTALLAATATRAWVSRTSVGPGPVARSSSRSAMPGFCSSPQQKTCRLAARGAQRDPRDVPRAAWA